MKTLRRCSECAVQVATLPGLIFCGCMPFSAACSRQIFACADLGMIYEQSERQAADICTTVLTNADTWSTVATLIGVYDPAVFDVDANIRFWASPPLPKASLKAELDAAAIPLLDVSSERRSCRFVCRGEIILFCPCSVLAHGVFPPRFRAGGVHNARTTAPSLRAP